MSCTGGPAQAEDGAVVAMKEYPEANYFLSISTVGDSIEPSLSELLPRAYLIEVNRLTTIVVVPWLPESPWPPSYPTSWDHWRDRDDAASFLFATNAISIAPTDGAARDQTVIFPEYPELAHTVFWRPRAEHEALVVDVERAYETPSPSRLRLLELSEGPLVELLRRDLARAALSTLERQILCLAPADSE